MSEAERKQDQQDRSYDPPADWGRRSEFMRVQSELGDGRPGGERERGGGGGGGGGGGRSARPFRHWRCIGTFFYPHSTSVPCRTSFHVPRPTPHLRRIGPYDGAMDGAILLRWRWCCEVGSFTCKLTCTLSCGRAGVRRAHWVALLLVHRLRAR